MMDLNAHGSRGQVVSLILKRREDLKSVSRLGFVQELGL